MGHARGLSGPTVVVLVIGFAATAAFGYAAHVGRDDAERRLAAQRAREASAVLGAGIPSIAAPLATTAALPGVAVAGDTGLFTAALSSQVGPSQRFASASLWPLDGSAPVAVVGADPHLAGEQQRASALFARAEANPGTLAVDGRVDEHRLGYAVASGDPGAKYVVYAERDLPAQPAATQVADSPFVGLDYAVYLGSDETASALLFASTTELPLGGRRVASDIPLGDTVLRLVTSPTTEFGGRGLSDLPWLILGVGSLLTIGGASMTEVSQRRRQRAVALAIENRRLFDEQRAGAEALQRGLLPDTLPDRAGVAVQARYATGVAGTEIGGDWYDAFAVGDHLFISCGDVSGRGLGAATVMAGLRFAIRALAPEADGPADTLRRLDALATIELDGHFATIVCALVDVANRRLVVASAGHPPPLVLDAAGARYLDVPVGPPVGAVGGASYEEATVEVGAEATVLLVTDGFIERRGEVVQVGLRRLSDVASQCTGTLDVMLDELTASLVDEHAADDAAALALRWLS